MPLILWVHNLLYLNYQENLRLTLFHFMWAHGFKPIAYLRIIFYLVSGRICFY